jgi:hypothetical protein
MDANVTIDVGNNISNMLTQLANKLGMTAETVFPWYVKQAYLEGVGTLCVFAVILLFCVISFGVSVYATRKHIDESVSTGASFVGIILMCVFIMIGSLEIPNAVCKIYNPEKAALTEIIQDVSRLTK